MVGGRQAWSWGWIFAIHVFQRQSEGDQRVRSPAGSQLKGEQCLQGSRQTQPLPQDLTQPIPAPHDSRNGKAAVGWCIPEAFVNAWQCVLEAIPLLQL